MYVVVAIGIFVLFVNAGLLAEVGWRIIIIIFDYSLRYAIRNENAAMGHYQTFCRKIHC
jgi:hypothetical protein